MRGRWRALGVEAGAPPVGQEVSVNGGVEETGEGVAVHQGVDLELGLLVHQVAGLRQGLVDSFSYSWVQTHLGQGKQIPFKNHEVVWTEPLALFMLMCAARSLLKVTLCLITQAIFEQKAKGLFFHWMNTTGACTSLGDNMDT